MKRHIILPILMAVGMMTSAASSTGGNTRVVTLDECRSLAIENNAAIKLAEGKARGAEEVKKGAFTKYFPTVSAQGIAFKTSNDIIDYDIFDLARLEMIKSGVAAGVTAVQPVFAGGRIVNGNKLASVGAEAGKLEQENAVDRVIVTVDQYYWQLVTLKSQKQTLAKVIQMVDTLNNQVSVAVKAGVIMRNDLLKVQLKRNDLLATMVDLDNGITLSRQLLAQYIGLDGESVDIPEPAMPGEVPPYPSGMYVDPASALPMTTDYRLLEAQAKAADLELKMAVGENLPTVGIGAGYFFNRVVHQNNNYGAVFVSVNIPISGWWGGSHTIKQKKIDVANAQTQLTDLSQMLKIKMTDAWDNLTAAHRKMTIAKESIAQAEENLRLNENYYKAGVSTISDLLDAQTLYRQACDQFTQSYGAYQLMLTRYLDATSQLSMK